jgi:hypothetical protein
MKTRLAVLAVLLAAPLQAQTGGASDVMARAISAYQDLEFDEAANLLRRVLAAPSANELADSTRARALTYLGAAEHYRGNADSAMAAFRRLVALAPHQAPDTLIFPPEVTRLYERVRGSMTAVAVQPTPPPPPPPPPVAAPKVKSTAPPPAHPDPGESATNVTVTVAGLITNVRTGSVAGTAAGFEGSVQLRRWALAVRYAEGTSDLVEGTVALRFMPTPWLSMQAGPHARRYTTPFGAERWVTWRLGGRGDFALAGTSLRGHATLWHALGLDVNVPPGSGSANGGEIGVTLDLGPRPVWFGLAYGIDHAQVRGGSQAQNVNTLTLTAGLRRR